MRPLVLFGTGDLADLLRVRMDRETPGRVAAFTADGDRVKAKTHEGIPIIPFGELGRVHPPGSIEVLVAIGYSGVNRFRVEKCREVVKAGYSLGSYISPKAVLSPDAVLGANAVLLENAVVEPFVRLGDSAVVWGNAFVGHHSELGEGVFVGPSAVICGRVTVASRAFLGAGCVVRDRVRVGTASVVGAGAVILRDVPDGAVWGSEPAREIPVKSESVEDI